MLEGIRQVLESPYEPTNLDMHPLRGSGRHDWLVAEVASGWFLTYQPFEDLPPIRRAVRFIALTHDPWWIDNSKPPPPATGD